MVPLLLPSQPVNGRTRVLTSGHGGYGQNKTITRRGWVQDQSQAAYLADRVSFPSRADLRGLHLAEKSAAQHIQSLSVVSRTGAIPSCEFHSGSQSQTMFHWCDDVAMFYVDHRAIQWLRSLIMTVITTFNRQGNSIS